MLATSSDPSQPRVLSSSAAEHPRPFVSAHHAKMQRLACSADPAPLVLADLQGQNSRQRRTGPGWADDGCTAREDTACQREFLSPGFHGTLGRGTPPPPPASITPFDHSAFQASSQRPRLGQRRFSSLARHKQRGCVRLQGYLAHEKLPPPRTLQ